MKLIVMGPPAAGKGTIGTIISKEYSIPLISTGDLLREEMKKGSGAGLEAKGYVDKGQYVPDEIVMKLLKQRLTQDDCAEGFILDGFPRTRVQAQALVEENVDVDIVLNFVVDHEVVIDRITGRLTCKECGAIYHVRNIPPKVEGKCDKCGGELYTRADQKEEVVKERLKVYEEKTAPLIDYYREKGLLKDIDANSPVPKEIFETVKPLLEEI